MEFIFIGTICLGTIFFTFLLKVVLQFTRNAYKLSKIPILFYPITRHGLSVPSDTTSFLRFFEEKTLEAIRRKEKMALYWNGFVPSVMLFHPESAEAYLKNKTNLNKSVIYKILRLWGTTGLALSDKQKWQQRRKLIAPSFHQNVLIGFLQIINDHASFLVNNLETMVSNNCKIDIIKQLKRCALTILCETLMGCKINDQTKENEEYLNAIHKMEEISHVRFSNPLLFNDFICNLTDTGDQQRKAIKVLRDFTAKIIEKKINSQKSTTENINQARKKALLDMLVSVKTEDGKKLSVRDIQEEVDNFMFAGHDTSASTLNWAIYLLGRYPDKQQKLHNELDAIFDDDKSCDVTNDHLKELVYLDLVIKEVLRLYSPSVFIGRKTDEKVISDGIEIPEGCDITIFSYIIQRHPDIWNEPNKFIPERFDVENHLYKERSPYAYLPFSAGPRNCIGQRFALQELKIILAKFFRQFSVVSLDEEKDLKVMCCIVLETCKSPNIVLTNR